MSVFTGGTRSESLSRHDASVFSLLALLLTVSPDGGTLLHLGTNGLPARGR